MQLGFAAHPWLKRKWEFGSAPHEPLGVLMSKNMPMSLGSTAGGTGACPCTAWPTIQWQSFPLTSRCLFLAMFAKEAYSFSHCGSLIHDNHWLCWLCELDGSGLQYHPILQDEDCNPDSYFKFQGFTCHPWFGATEIWLCQKNGYPKIWWQIIRLTFEIGILGKPFLWTDWTQI